MGPPDQPMDQPMDQRKRAALRGERDLYWKDIAWNGLFFRIPPAWEIGRIGLRYLLFEDDAGPVFELKWQPVKKGFSFDVHLKRLGAAYSRKRGIDLKPTALPEQWREALVGFEARFFQWGSGSATGQGAVLYCETCRTAHLLQFLRRDIVRNKRLCLGILRSFGDHPAADEGGERLWAIYDIRAKVPCEYQLQRYRFTPGAFELAFSGPRREALSLFRWGPASVLLEHQSLRRFLDRQVPGSDPYRKWSRSGTTAVCDSRAPCMAAWLKNGGCGCCAGPFTGGLRPPTMTTPIASWPFRPLDATRH
jgi:hypothetical protein